MRTMVTMAAALALAGCGSSQSDESANAANAADFVPKPGPMLGGVDLDKPVRASGTEPYWALEVAPGAITYTDFSVGAGKVTDLYPVSPTLSGGKAVYQTQTPKGDKVTITLIDADCLESGEPEDSDPLTVELKIGARELKGCARPRPADETGAASAANASAP